MKIRIAIAAVAAVALAAAGVAAAAAVTHRSSLKGTVTLHKTKLGKVLATKSGMTLYLFVADRHGRSVCYGACAANWPPLLVKGKPSAGTGVKAKLLGVTKRKDGKRQVTYKGRPLYRFALDKKAGQTAGEGQNFFGGLWWGVSATGKAVKHESAPPPTTGTTTTSPYPGY